MIRHIVMFKIKEEYKAEIPQLVENFYGMKGRIEGMVNLEAGADFLGSERSYDLALITEFTDRAAFDAWAERWRARLAETGREGAAIRAEMDRVNPKFIPRNHQVEWALEAAAEQGDYGPFEELLGVIQHPFEEQPRFEAYAELPPEMKDYQTFCGT